MLFSPHAYPRVCNSQGLKDVKFLLMRTCYWTNGDAILFIFGGQNFGIIKSIVFLFICALYLFIQKKSPKFYIKGCYFIELNARKIAWYKIK